MKRFRKFVEDKEKKENPVIILFDQRDSEASVIAAKLLEEAKTYEIDSRYSARFDKAYQPNQQDHTHIYLKGNEVCVVNKDGTPSHGSEPFKSLPKYVQTGIRRLGLVECRFILTEAASAKPGQLIPPKIMRALHNLLSLGQKRSGDGEAV